MGLSTDTNIFYRNTSFQAKKWNVFSKNAEKREKIEKLQNPEKNCIYNNSSVSDGMIVWLRFLQNIAHTAAF